MTATLEVRECRDVLLRLPDPEPTYRYGGQCEVCGEWCNGLPALAGHYLREHPSISATGAPAPRQVHAEES